MQSAGGGGELGGGGAGGGGAGGGGEGRGGEGGGEGLQDASVLGSDEHSLFFHVQREATPVSRSSYAPKQRARPSS